MSGEREREERIAERIYNSQDNPQDDSYAVFVIVLLFIVCAIVLTPLVINSI